MTKTMSLGEAKLVATLRCAFALTTEQITKMLWMLWGQSRVQEIVGSADVETLGCRLLSSAEKQLGLTKGELNVLSLEECKCISCGHEEFYLTTLVDTGKQCAKCKNKNSVFLPAIDIWDPDD